jgi:hypothetical protein
MIERPRRAVTFFFVPLIDVLILLFCIFLLMPFVATPPAGEPEPEPKAKTPEPELPRDVRELQEQLQRARREVNRLRAERGNLAERLSVKVLEIDPKDGRLYYYQDGQRINVGDERAAENLKTVHKRASGTREPFFLILSPRRSGFPSVELDQNIRRWFRDVQFQLVQP